MVTALKICNTKEVSHKHLVERTGSNTFKNTD